MDAVMEAFSFVLGLVAVVATAFGAYQFGYNRGYHSGQNSMGVTYTSTAMAIPSVTQGNSYRDTPRGGIRDVHSSPRILSAAEIREAAAEEEPAPELASPSVTPAGSPIRTGSDSDTTTSRTLSSSASGRSSALRHITNTPVADRAAGAAGRPAPTADGVPDPAGSGLGELARANHEAAARTEPTGRRYRKINLNRRRDADSEREGSSRRMDAPTGTTDNDNRHEVAGAAQGRSGSRTSLS